MATTTPNYGWSVPTSSDYVAQGAVAIETLGDSVDSTLFTALGGAYPGMRLVKKQTIGSGVSTVTVTAAFSATYPNYKIIVSDGVGSAAQAIGLRLGASAVNYAYALNVNNYSGGASSVLSSGADVRWQYAGESNGLYNNMNIDLHNPFLAKATTLQGNYTGNGSGGSTVGIHNVATSYTDFTINVAGSMTGGTIYVYGYGAS
jgi:hypothetical protein